jgi:hypothetical protein
MRRENRPTAYVLIGVSAVLFAAFMVWFVVTLSRDPEARSNLGDTVFEIGDAQGAANAIDRDGPLLVADPLRRGRNLVVDRAGGAWVAYAVRPSGPHCRLELDRERRRVVDTCTGPVADTADRPHYEATVDDGRLVIDLRREVSPAG